MDVPPLQNASDVCIFNEEFKFFLLPASYSAVLVLGLPLNLTAMWIFVARMRPWSPTTVYMFNLALSDTLYLLSLPTLIYYYAHRNNWPFGEVPCKAVRFLFYTNLYCSILFLTCISVHRYVGVCHPLFSLQRMKAKYAHMICLGVWASVSVCLIPNLRFVTVTPNGNDTICHDTTRPEDFEHYVEYSTAVMSLLFGLPCLVTAGCYGLMTRELMKPMVNATRRTLPAYKRRSIKTIIVVLTVFILCFLPFHVTRTLYYYARLLDADCSLLNVVNLIYKITRPLASANSCLDPVLYFLASENYQKRLAGAAAGFSDLCWRRPLAGRRVNTARERDGPAVIPVCFGSLGNLLGDGRDVGCRDEMEVDGDADNGGREETSTKREGTSASGREKNMGANGEVGEGDGRGEDGKDEGGSVGAGNHGDPQTARKQSNNLSERRRNTVNGDTRRKWSGRSIRGAEGSQNETYESDEERAPSSDLLDTQRGRSVYREEGNSRADKLHFLPNI